MKNMLFKILDTFLKMCILVIQSTQLLVVRRHYVFIRFLFLIKHFFQTIRMPTFTKFLRVLTYRKGLPFINLHDTSMD